MGVLIKSVIPRLQSTADLERKRRFVQKPKRTDVRYIHRSSWRGTDRHRDQTRLRLVQGPSRRVSEK